MWPRTQPAQRTGKSSWELVLAHSAPKRSSIDACRLTLVVAKAGETSLEA